MDLEPLNAFISRSRSLPIYGDDPRNHEGQKIFSASAVYNGDKLQTYLYIIIRGEIYDSIFSDIQSNQHLSQSIGLLLGAVIFFFFVLLGLLRFLTLPLQKLSSSMRAFRIAGFEKSKLQLNDWPSAAHNEVHELGSAFNEMAEQINYQLAQLQSSDKQRRELLMHLSHDLRTPLASLQGYLETVKLKGRDLSEQQQQRFIDIAFKNASQLNKLVEQIFELAHLQDEQVTLNLESFPLGELLHDIAAKFSYKAGEKNISLSVQPEQCTFNVYSDIGKLERVLTNLLENAVRHTAENGKIIIKVSEQTVNQLKLQVIDNGSGINAAELAYVFDPRYRASNAVNDQKEHSGLGLAITHKLLSLLKSEIRVSSELGHGTTFSFNLNRCR
ncbi:HAMP domain-containing sensor histidine kinase [Psychromonas ossibalaenae]|uniref:sensor histidine kinase n=1 Tax=Psychromonas ossibalaenae TaxID=444922 RepID=UPI00316ABD35